MSPSSRSNACFVKDLKHMCWENARFFTLIQSVNKMLFRRNIKAVSSANFIFPPKSLHLHCWQKFLSSASNHCINKSRFVNHDLGCLQMRFVIFHSILQEEYLAVTASILRPKANEEAKEWWCQRLHVQHAHWMSQSSLNKCGASQVFP